MEFFFILILLMGVNAILAITVAEVLGTLAGAAFLALASVALGLLAGIFRRRIDRV